MQISYSHWARRLGAVAVLLLGSAWASCYANSAREPDRCKALLSGDLSSVPDAPTQIIDATLAESDASSRPYCRVQGYVSPQVGFELRLPVDYWNGKLLQIGCGGHCGDTSFAALCPLTRGYACIVSDAGHKGGRLDALWGEDNWQAKIDWGYRAPHVATLAGKAILERFYGVAPTRSYFIGGSTGGRQALQEVQRFPWDFDGVVAIAPPTDLSTLYMMFAWGYQATHDKQGQPLLGTAELKLLNDAAVTQCDVDDGAKDGIIGDARHCAFDPSRLACTARRTTSCLRAVQLNAVQKIYAGPMTSRGVKLGLGGPLPGSELVDPEDATSGWRGSYLGNNGQPAIYEKLATDGLRYLFFSPSALPGWTLADFNFDRDYQRLGVMQALYDATNADLRRFKDAQGKLMIFQGMNDNSVLPRSTIDYYETIERTMGGRAATQAFVRLFLLPGVGHGMGGPGADTIDYLGALEAWVEEGKPPDRLIAAHLKRRDVGHKFLAPFPLAPDSVAFTRPVCPYPRYAKYEGRGNLDDAASFTCKD